MNFRPHSALQGMAGALMCLAVVAGAQTPSAPTPPSTTATDSNPATASSSTPAPTAPPAAPVWSVGSVDLSGYLDGYFTYNHNRPVGESNNLYNFNDKDQFNLEGAKLTLNHDPDPVGAHLDILFGRTNAFLHPGSYGGSADGSGINYIEQAYMSVKPPKAKGFELDFGQFVTSAGQEVIETMNNWSYSHGILFSYAIPYYHFGLRTSIPVTKTWTAGVQVVNGWNNVTANNGGVTIGLTSSLVKPKYTWNTNYYVGPENGGLPPNYGGTQKGYRNLFDTTLLLTPNAKFNAYINYDYGQNRIPAYTYNSDGIVNVKSQDPHWQGVAFSARAQTTANSALIVRYEYFYDNQGFATGYGYSGDYLESTNFLKTNDQEFTGTYEYKWLAGLLLRAEYRVDWSNKALFNYGNDVNYGTGAPTKDSQQTATIGLIAFFGPKR
jgi:hypothetical protein